MSERERWEAILAAIDLRWGKYDNLPPVGESIEKIRDTLFGPEGSSARFR
jgi:hypothetical protein